jgi:hypothetical protein
MSVVLTGCFYSHDGEDDENPCRGVPTREVWMEVNWNLDEGLGSVSDCVDLDENGRLRLAFAEACTEFEQIEVHEKNMIIDQYPMSKQRLTEIA